MLIVGGGVIGIEWASMLNDFGVKVTVIEFADRILPTEDQDISKEMEKLLTKKGITLVTNAKVLPDTAEKHENLVKIQVEQGGDTQSFEAEKLLLSVGRVPNVEGIGLENTDIQTEKQGIVVNEHYQTERVAYLRNR